MKLKDVCTIIAGQSPASRYYNKVGNGLPFFQGKADFGDLYPNITTYCTEPIRIAEKDDILLSVRAPVGATNLSPGKVCIGRGLTALRPKDVLETKYLLYFFKCFEVNLQNKGRGTTFSSITQSEIKDIDIAVPSLFVQQRIVARIEELLSELDKAEETLLKTKEQLEVYRQAVLKEAFGNYNKVKLSLLCKCITDGDHMPPPKAESGIPFIMISNVKNNKINWENTAFVESDYYNNLDEKRKPIRNDILYTVTGSFGIPVLVDFDKEFCFQRHIALLRPENNILPEYLFYSLKHPDVYLQASKKATGTAQKTVGLGVLRNIEIPFVDDLDVQHKIIEEIKIKEVSYVVIEETIAYTLEKIKSLRQAILKEAFTGKLV